jgi:hypothetical protein
VEAAAFLAAQPGQQRFKGDVSGALHQQAHRIDDRTPAAMQLDRAARPVAEALPEMKAGRMHRPIVIQNK